MAPPLKSGDQASMLELAGQLSSGSVFICLLDGVPEVGVTAACHQPQGVAVAVRVARVGAVSRLRRAVRHGNGVGIGQVPPFPLPTLAATGRMKAA